MNQPESISVAISYCFSLIFSSADVIQTKKWVLLHGRLNGMLSVENNCQSALNQPESISVAISTTDWKMSMEYLIFPHWYFLQFLGGLEFEFSITYNFLILVLKYEVIFKITQPLFDKCQHIFCLKVQVILKNVSNIFLKIEFINKIYPL